MINGVPPDYRMIGRDYYTRSQLMRALDVDEEQIEKWITRGTGPKNFIHQDMLLYPHDEVVKWQAEPWRGFGGVRPGVAR